MGISYLIDTHILLWWLFDDPKLNAQCRDIIRNPDFNIIVSPVFLGDELTPILQQHYQRLSEIEKQAIALLANATVPASIPQLREKYKGSHDELLKAIQSLDRRGIITKLSCESETVFTIPPVLKQYVKMVAE